MVSEFTFGAKAVAGCMLCFLVFTDTLRWHRE